MKKVISLVLALVMIMALGTTAFAQTIGNVAEGTGSLTINDAQPGQQYSVYRIFSAIPTGNHVSYKLLDNKTMETNAYFSVDTEGNVTANDAAKDDNGFLTADAIKWLEDNKTVVGELVKIYGADYVTPSSTTTGEGEDAVTTYDDSIIINGLAYGYYYVTTTTGTAVSVDTTNKNATVDDKNPPTTITKEITSAASGDRDANGKNAIAQVGTAVSYESRINIKDGAYNYKFTDTMTDGLTLIADSVKVYVVAKDAEVAEDAEAVNATCGTVTAANTTGNNADITILFSDTWLKANEGKDIVIQYSATVNAGAFVATASNPNTAKIEYGNESAPLTDEDSADVWSARIKVEKVDGEGKALADAGFVLKNAAGKYYKNTEGVVSWVDTEADATEYKSNGTGGNDADKATEATTDDPDYDVVFTGLQNGTYTLVEKTVPEGYNKAADKTFTIAADNYNLDNLEQSAIVINNAGSELPTTGGIGTTIFYVLGTVMVLGAAVLLITKRRMIVE